MNHGLPERTMNILFSIFHKYQGIQQVILYGSRAMGNHKNGSDIDITLKVDNSFTRTDLLHIAGDLDDSNIPYLVDVCIYETLTNPDLKEHIDRVGKIIYINTVIIS